MPSRNLFILAAAMQLPLALWLHGCKDDDTDKDKDTTKEGETTTEPKEGETTPAETPKEETDKSHAKFFLEGQYKELIKDLAAHEGKGVEFKVRTDFFDQKAEKVTATALASYINESTEGMVSLYGSAFKYEDLRKEWRAEYVAEMWESEMQLQVAPGTVSTPALQWYMNGKTNQVMFSQMHFSNGANVAQTKVVDALGSFEHVNQNPNQQMVAPKRNLIVTELYHGGYDTVIATPPKNNPNNLAVTFFQVSQDMDVFWEICVRAFHQVISINQMFAMTVSTDDITTFGDSAKMDKTNLKPDHVLNAWEVIQEKETNKWTLNTHLGSRKPEIGGQRTVKYLHDRQLKIEEIRVEIVRMVKTHFSEPTGKKFVEAHGNNGADWSDSKFFEAYLAFAIKEETDTGPIATKIKAMITEVNKVWDSVQKDSMFTTQGKVKRMDDVDALKAHPNDFTKTKMEDVDALAMPDFLYKLFINNHSLTPLKGGYNAFEEFRRECRRSNFNYLLPSRKELMQLEQYKIEVLEVIHPGSDVDIVFAEVMLAAFYQTFRSLKKATYLQHPSNHQVIMGDASAIVGHNGYNPYQQPTPVTRALDFKNDMMIKVLRFVTVESEVECFKTVMERLNTVEIEVTIKEHKQVAKLKPGKKNTIGEHIRTMQ